MRTNLPSPLSDWTLRDAGANKVYISNLAFQKAGSQLKAILRLV